MITSGIIMNIATEIGARGLPDGSVNLDIARLKSLRLGLGMSQEALSESCAERRLSLSLASIKRAESGKPVLYRTARRLAAFFDVTIQDLVQWSVLAAPGGASAAPHALERAQCGAALDAAKLSGSGRLIEMHGETGAGKSRLLAACADDARQRGYRCIELRVDRHRDAAASPLPALACALLDLPLMDMRRVSLEADIAQRLAALGLPALHAAGCLALLTGLPSLPWAMRPQPLGTLDALVRCAARARPLMLSIDDMHRADGAVTAALEYLLPASIACPVTWMLAFDSAGGHGGAGICTAPCTVARTVYHLA